MIGAILQSEETNYFIEKMIAGPDRPNANIYLCSNHKGGKFIAKHFYKSRPMPDIGYNKYNHYGRRRDGSSRVFEEIKETSYKYSFLVRHIDRINYNGKWIIIQEYINGITLEEFIYNNYENSLHNILLAIKNLAFTLKCWHTNHFAHGDPHLCNVLVSIEDNKEPIIKLIDYSQIHHPSFHYCKKYKCFQPLHKRIENDLNETSGKLGKGFEKELSLLSEELELGSLFLDEFKKFYR